MSGETIGGEATTGTVQVTGHQGDEIEAYLARPSARARAAAWWCIHHMPGYDRATKEITRRFAEHGYDAICPNLHWRDAPGAGPDDAAAAARAARRRARRAAGRRRRRGRAATCAALPTLQRQGRRDRLLLGRAAGRSWPPARLDLDAAVDCYGAFVVGTPPEGFPLQVGQPRRPAAEPALPAARPVRRRGPATRRPSRSPSWTRSLTRARQGATSSTATTDAGHALLRRRPARLPRRGGASTAGSGSSTSSAATWPPR